MILKKVQKIFFNPEPKYKGKNEIASLKFPETLFTNKNPNYKKYNIGDFTYGFPLIYNYDEYDDTASQPTKLKIGKFCSIGDNVKIILGSEHRLDWITTYPFNSLFNEYRFIKGHPHSKGDISIGNDVWISTNVTILSGVTIGNGAVIGANSLVTKNIPAYAVAYGQTAEVKRFRFEKQIISQLEEIQWWNLSFFEIKKYIPLLQSNQIEKFIKIFKEDR